MNRFIQVFSGLLLVTSTTFLEAETTKLQTLQGYVSKDVTISKIIRDVNGSRKFGFIITISLRNKEKLEKYLQDICNPQSQQYHHPIIDNDFIEMFRPHKDYEKLSNLLNSQGLKVVQEWGDHKFIVFGSLSNIQNFFHVHIHEYLKPDGKKFWSPDREPSIDSDVPILGLTGFIFYNLSKSEKDDPSAQNMAPAKPNVKPVLYFGTYNLEGRQNLDCRLPDGYDSAKIVDGLNDKDCLEINFYLPYRNQETLNEFYERSEDSKSPLYRHHLSTEDQSAMFWPSETDYETLINYLKLNGFNVIDVYKNRSILSVNGAVEDVQKIFKVHLFNYQRPDGSKFLAPDGIPSIDLKIPISELAGLSGDTQWAARPGPPPRPLLMAEFKPQTPPDEIKKIISSFGTNGSTVPNPGDWIIFTTDEASEWSVIQQLNNNPAVRHAMALEIRPLLKYGEILVKSKKRLNKTDRDHLVELVGKDVSFAGWPRNYLLIKITNEMKVNEAIQLLKKEPLVQNADLPPRCGVDEIVVSFKNNTSSTLKKSIISKVGITEDITYDPKLLLLKLKKNMNAWDAIKKMKQYSAVEHANFALNEFRQYP